MSRFFVEIFLSRSIEKFVGGSSVFHKFSGIDVFYVKEGEEEEGVREYQDFPSIFLCHQCWKIS